MVQSPWARVFPPATYNLLYYVCQKSSATLVTKLAENILVLWGGFAGEEWFLENSNAGQQPFASIRINAGTFFAMLGRNHEVQ